MTRKQRLAKLRALDQDIGRLGAKANEARAHLGKAVEEERDLLEDVFAPMSEEMREKVNECIRFQLAKNIEITEHHIDQAMVHSYFADRFFFAAYTPWGIACIEQAFLERMKHPEAGESKRRIKRDIQTNAHLHPKIKRGLFKALVRARVHVDYVKHLDRLYCDRIMGGETGRAFEDEIAGNTNLPEATRENLLYNLRNLSRVAV